MFTWKKYVYEVYKEKSFSRAAKNLFISQPSLSARIKKVEEQLGAPIFDRSTTPVKLTQFGEAYIKATEEIFRIEQQMTDLVDDLSMLKVGHLAIGASNLLAAYALPPIILAFQQKYPNVSIQLIEGNTSDLEVMLRSNKVDLVIENHPFDSALFNRTFYCQETILLAVPRSLPIWDQLSDYELSYEDIQKKRYLQPEHPAVPLDFLRDTPFIMLTPGNDTRTRGDKLCREAGFHPKAILELNQQSSCYMAASTQLGATFISDILVTRLPSFEQLAYYKLEGEAAVRDVYFYHKKHSFKTRAMEEFLSGVQNAV